MNKFRWMVAGGAFLLAFGTILAGDGKIADLVSGKNAFVDARDLKPGTFRKITADDLPQPFATESARNTTIGPRPAGALPAAPAGFKVELYLDELKNPRQIRVAPNGDFFVTETRAGEILVLRGRTPDGKPQQMETFATGQKGAFGVNFYPPGPNPQWVYVGNTASVVRFPYKNGDMKASGPAEVLIPELPTGGHSTRDVVFSKDGKQMLVAVGSGSNVDDPDTHPGEIHRANILAGRESRNRRGMVLSERTRCTGRQPGARLYHARDAGRLLWLALVLHRRPSGSAPGGQTSGTEEQGSGSRRIDAATQCFARPHLLRGPAISGGISRRSVCRRARLLEPRSSIGTRSGPGAFGQRTCQWGVRGFSYVPGSRRTGMGPTSGRCGGPGWGALCHRRQFTSHLAR